MFSSYSIFPTVGLPFYSVLVKRDTPPNCVVIQVGTFLPTPSVLGGRGMAWQLTSYTWHSEWSVLSSNPGSFVSSIRWLKDNTLNRVIANSAWFP